MLLPVSAPAAGAPPIIIPMFLAGMRDHGWLENQSFVVEARYAGGRPERLPELAGELVRLGVDVIVAMGTPAAMAAKQATGAIPIVFGLVGDPVGSRLVANLSHPGANVTGMSVFGTEVIGKALEILHEALPRAERVVLTRDRGNLAQALADPTADAVARARGLQLHRVDVANVSDFDAAFETAVRRRADAVLVYPVLPLPKRIADFALKNRLPTMTMIAAADAQVGQLITYGVNFGEQVRRMPAYVVRILKGAKPADLPVEQATRFELVINLRTARALGLTIPPSLLLRADQVIE
jgi:putative ABC transport system substrate-binding protein